MKEKIEFDGKKVIHRAATNLAMYYMIKDGEMHDFRLYIPRDFDPDQTHSGRLGEIVEFVRDACVEIFLEDHPDTTEESVTIHYTPDVMRKVVWGVFERLKLQAFYELDPHTGMGVGYSPMQHHELWDITTHNRITPIFWEWLQETYDTLMQTHVRYLNDRYTLLVEFSAAENSSEREKLLPYLERCCQEISDIRKDIVHFCEKHRYKNPFVPPEREEITEFEQAVNWNEAHVQAEILDSFTPSSSESPLFWFLPAWFKKYEWPLFQFRFTEDDQGGQFEQGDMHSFGEQQYERKMLIAYYTHLHLLMHRQWILNLSPHLVDATKRHVAKLDQEIQDLKRKKMNGGDDPEEVASAHKWWKLVTYDIARIQELATAAGNIVNDIDASMVNIEILSIMERLTDLLHAFYASAIQIRTDDDLDNLDKQQIIRDLRESLLEQLHLLQGEIASVHFDDPALDKAENVIAQSIQHLEQY